MKKNLTRILSLLLVLVLMVGVLPVSALADGWDLTGELDTEQLFERAEPVEMQSKPAVDGYDYSIMFLDCGRKYYSVDSIKALIDNASAAGFNYIQLAVGNDGLRLLLDDMSLTVNGTTYSSEAVSSAIHAGNEAYYNFDVDELTQSEMDTIIDYATSKGMGVIPCVNTPGHMDAILDAATSLTGKNCSYNGSARTIDVTNDTAVAFTQALLQKYITYFAGKGCQLFNMGADEYANDIYTGGGMGFGNLQTTRKYSYYVTYVNQVAKMIKDAGMTPMAFNDGIYFNSDTSSGKFDTDIIICYWSNGWSGYYPMSASDLAAPDKGFKLVNTSGAYYWVLGKPNDQCSAEKARGFNYQTFPKQGGDETISNPAGAMFCIWGDNPGAETEASVISKTAATIEAFGGTLPKTNPGSTTPVFKVVGDVPNGGTLTMGCALTLRVPEGMTAIWTASPEGIVQIEVPDSANANRSVTGSSVKVTALKAGDVTITATNPDDTTQTANFTLTVQPRKATDITVYVGQDHTITVNGSVQIEAHPNANIATVTTEAGTSSVPVFEKITSTAGLESGNSYLIESAQAANKGNNATLLTNEASGNMLKLSGTQSATPPSAKWTITKYSSSYSNYYYVQSVSNYLNIGDGTATLSTSRVPLVLSTMQNGGSTYWDISRTPVRTTYHLNQYGGASAAVAAGYTDSAENDPGSCWNIYKITEGTTPSTTITFHGVAEGDTTATIGGVDYNIHVVSKTLANVDPLEIEFWITNQKLYDNENTHNQENHTMSIHAADANVNSEDGVAIDKKTPSLAYNEDKKEHHYWMTVRLDSDHKQTASDGVDQTAAGTTLTHVRYLNDAWQYKTLAGDWESFQTGDQLVAYYLQKTTVTKDIETFVKDWGSVPGAFQGYPVEHVALTIAIVYPDGTIQPAEEKMYSEATTIFNYWNNRNIGIIVPKINENYTISKMTVTDGTRQITSSSDDTNYAWYANDTIKWETVKNEAGVDWYDETLVWNSSMNTEPMINASGLTGELKTKCTWSAANTAKLVLIYLEPIQKDTNLNIVYHNDTDNETILRSQIAMVYNAGDPQPTYDNSLHYNNAPLPMPNDRKWSGTAPSEPNYLPDEAYVVNAAGNHQTFNKNVAKIPSVAPKYQSGFYKYYGADVSADGKTLTLHYVIDNAKLTKQYVLDFGLPLRIPLKDLIDNDLSTVEGVYANGVPLDSTTDYNTQHGTLRYDAASHEIIYTRTATFSDNTISTANFQIMYRGATTLSKTITIGVIPASNILYEENFLTPAEDTSANRLSWTLDTAGSLGSTKQATHKNDVEAIFGYDDAYKNSTGSNGAWKVSNLSKESSVSKPLTAEFYGNALDVIGTCDANTAMLMMIISNVDNPSAAKKPVLVDTRYNGGTLNQVPFAHVELESDAHYSVNIRAYYAPAIAASNTNTAATFGAVSAISDFAASASYADQAVWSQMAHDLAEDGLSLDDVEFVRFDDTASAAQTDSFAVYADLYSVQQPARPEGTNLAIDAFRVYRSSDSNDAIGEKYIASEQNMVYENIIDVVKNEVITAYTENGQYSGSAINGYESAGGPQNEIYLAGGLSVAFKVENAGDTIQVSLRAVQGAAQWATSENGTPTSINTNTEMYYTITKDSSGNFVIANRGDALLAIGNVKLPSGAKTMSASEIDEDALRASLCAALGLSAGQPQAFQPKTFTARATTLPMLRNKRVSVLITISNDVSYVTVNGVKYTPSRYYASWQKTRLIQFGETLGKYESKTYTIIAYDANGVASAPITVNG